MLIYPLITIVAFLFYYLVNEAIHKKLNKSTYFTRKLAHVLSGLGAALVTLYLDRVQFMIVTGFFSVAFVIFYKYKTFKSIHLKNSIGEVLYPLSLFLMALFLYEDKNIFLAGIFILAVSDTVSAILGKKYTDNYNPFYSYSGHVLTTLVILLVFHFPLFPAIIISLILGITEFVTFKGWDNLSVPAVYTLLILLF